MAKGFVTFKEYESESEITNLLSIFGQSHDNPPGMDNLEILLYSSKTLSVPCSAQGFVWCLATIRMNVEQGKLYVMVTEKVNELHHDKTCFCM